MSRSIGNLVISLVVLSCAAVGQNGGLRFTLTDLGTIVANGYWSQARAINNNGQIVGYYLWSIKRLSGQGCFSKLPGQPAVAFGNNWCVANAVNASGAVAGSMQVGTCAHAFLRDVSGNLHDLPPPADNACYSYGQGIDVSGRVVGYGLAENNAQKAVQWGTNFAPTVFGCPLQGGAAAYATNPAGNIFAGYCPGTYGISPFWWFNANPYPLSNLNSACPGGMVYAMNNGNYMVGYSYGSGCSPHAVLWGNGVVDLGPGQAYSISADNWVVGANGAGVAFLRVSDPNCPQTVILNLLLDSSGAGWSVNAAYGINDSHQIVGQGLAPNGQYHAILLSPANSLPLCYPD
jgi:uncharacterized membrane protein